MIIILFLLFRLDIKKFSVKLSKLAVHFCAVEKERLVGFLGCYFNDPHKEYGYISSFSIVSEYQGKGVAIKLLNAVIEYGIQNGFKQIRLQVHTSNLSAIRLYSESGFLESSHNRYMSDMELNI
jgi:ribosomal protein S18 acetylase RimI-like enzyme